jgi:hypothetical protein
MAKNRYLKDIACLESLWDTNVENKLTVAPLLELIASINYIRFTHLTCNTLDELEFNLRSLPSRRTYKILYLAFHGNPGEIQLGDDTVIPLEKLATMMGRKFAGWIIHFGTCGTLQAPRPRLRTFFRETRVAMLLGYRKDVDWIESAAMDLILLDWLQSYKSLPSMWKRVRGSYRDLIAATGLTVFSGP